MTLLWFSYAYLLGGGLSAWTFLSQRELRRDQPTAIAAAVVWPAAWVLVGAVALSTAIEHLLTPGDDQ